MSDTIASDSDECAALSFASGHTSPLQPFFAVEALESDMMAGDRPDDDAEAARAETTVNQYRIERAPPTRASVVTRRGRSALFHFRVRVTDLHARPFADDERGVHGFPFLERDVDRRALPIVRGRGHVVFAGIDVARKSDRGPRNDGVVDLDLHHALRSAPDDRAQRGDTRLELLCQIGGLFASLPENRGLARLLRNARHGEREVARFDELAHGHHGFDDLDAGRGNPHERVRGLKSFECAREILGFRLLVALVHEGAARFRDRMRSARLEQARENQEAEDDEPEDGAWSKRFLQVALSKSRDRDVFWVELGQRQVRQVRLAGASWKQLGSKRCCSA